MLGLWAATTNSPSASVPRPSDLRLTNGHSLVDCFAHSLEDDAVVLGDALLALARQQVGGVRDVVARLARAGDAHLGIDGGQRAESQCQ